MMSDPLFVQLQDYVDGVLPDDEVQAVEKLLESNSEARKEVAFLRSLAKGADHLPIDVAPRRDLWAGIADQIDQPEHMPTRSWGRWVSLAAAAVVLMAISSALTVFWMQRTAETPVVVQVDDFTPSPAMAAWVTSDQTYSAAIGELLQVLHNKRSQLAPETIAVIEEELKHIDDAIRVSRAALATDPNNSRSMHTILALQRKQVELLQQAVNLPHGG